MNRLLDLSPEARLELADLLWDSVSPESEGHALADEEREILDTRLEDMETNGPDGLTWEQVKASILSGSK
ncbi:MAG: addiction module protein [Tepidisphaeraceae bacterium]